MESAEWIKAEILGILKSFDMYCKKHDIKYCLAYGTLLGAIRHRGFIPWDDDIDVVLTTNEYFKLKRLVTNNPYLDEEKRYRVLTPGDEDYCYSFIKVEDTRFKIREKNIADRYSIGLFIDVFRVDYWPESNLIEMIELKKARLLLKLNEICIRGSITDGKYYIIDKLLKPVDFIFKTLGLKTEKFCKRLELQGTNNKRSVYMGNIMSGSGRKSERLDASIFDEYTNVCFEGHLFPAPKKYDEYLREIYGDYMVIPDRDHQVGHQYEIVENKE